MHSIALRALIPLIDFSQCSPALSFSVEVGTTGGGNLALLCLSLGASETTLKPHPCQGAPSHRVPIRGAGGEMQMKVAFVPHSFTTSSSRSGVHTTSLGGRWGTITFLPK